MALGLTRGELRAAVARGLLARPRRGVLVIPFGIADAAGGSRPRRELTRPVWAAAHESRIRAAIRSVGPRALVSHESAGFLHGLALPSAAEPRIVSLIVPGGVNFDGPGLRVRGSGVPLRDRVVVNDLRVTSPARTAVDLARGRPLPSALIPLDSTARALLASATGSTGNALRRATRDDELRHRARAELELALDACFGWPGTRAVRTALMHIDPAAESPAESRSRGWFLEAGLGPLDPGAPIVCGASTYWADFCDPTQRIIGEVDGWGKYGDSHAELRQALEGERTRQRHLESDGWRLVRWSSSERRGPVVTRMSTALGRM
jgi:hypothetical protein